MRLKQDGNKHILNYVVAIWKSQKKDFNTCELCQKHIPDNQYNIHHTKYNNATIYDLKIVCRKCNHQIINTMLD